MRLARLLVTVGAAAACVLTGAAVASPTSVAPVATPTAAPTPTPERFDRVDVVTLMAVVIEEQQNQGSVVLQNHPPSAMPAWDPLVYYAGIGADRHQPFSPIVWTIADTKAQGYEHALLRAYVMAVMDIGEAGPKFKRAYDVAAGEDQALPSDAKDPYRYRHAVAEPFVTELTQMR